VGIVEEQDDRARLREVGEKDGEAAGKAQSRWLLLCCGSSQRGDRTEQCRQIVREPVAQRADLLLAKSAQMAFQRFRPDAEGSHAAERMAASRQADGPVAFSREKLASDPRLSNPRVADH
jgi:hypothetical protein